MNDVIFAYLDPGTGSYLLQMALAGLLAASYALRHFWGRMKSFFVRSSGAAATPHDDGR